MEDILTLDRFLIDLHMDHQYLPRFSYKTDQESDVAFRGETDGEVGMAQKPL
jgi:hypothetical protein